VKDIEIRGNATPDERAALTAALNDRAAEDPYERWRRGRIAALSASPASRDR
jgi:hypothetical protein